MSEVRTKNLNKLAKEVARTFDIKDRAGLRAAIHWANAIRETIKDRPPSEERGSLEGLADALSRHLEPLDGALRYLQTEANWLSLYEQDGERAEAVEIALRTHYRSVYRALEDLRMLAQAANAAREDPETERAAEPQWLIPVVKHLARYWRDEVRQPFDLEFRDGRIISRGVEFLQAVVRGTGPDTPGIQPDVPSRRVEAAARAIRSHL